VPDWTVRFDTGKLFELLLSVKDLNNDLTHIAMTALRASEEFTIYSQNFDPSGEQIVNISFEIPKDGRWKFVITALDKSGNQSVLLFPDDGTSILVDHDNNTTGTPFIHTYQTHGKKVKNLYFGAYPTNAYTVKWQIKDRGVAPDAQGAGGGAWTTATTITAVTGGYKYGVVPPFDRKKKTLYAFAKVGSKNNSATVQFNLQ
jgi:hypothetical protein